MWSLGVVMSDVDPKHAFKVATTHDEHMIETVIPKGPDNALRVGICPGRANRTAQRHVTRPQMPGEARSLGQRGPVGPRGIA